MKQRVYGDSGLDLHIMTLEIKTYGGETFSVAISAP